MAKATESEWECDVNMPVAKGYSVSTATQSSIENVPVDPWY